MKKEFTYNGLIVKRDYFSHAIFPMDCSMISDSKMQDIVEKLYNILHVEYEFEDNVLKGDGDTFKDESLLIAYNEELEYLLIDNGVKYL